jgi:toxin ParE1/3/4
MLPYVLHPLAARELDETVAHYESVQPGKGLEFAERVKAAIEQVRAFPESAPATRDAVRSLVIQPSSRWSFTVHYRVIPDGIRILAVAHHKRQPFYWFRRR